MRKDAQRRPKTRKQKNFKTFFLKTCKINRGTCGGPGRIQKNPQNSDPKPYISLSKILLILIRIVWVLAPYFHPWISRYELQLHRVFSTVEAFSEQIKAKFWFLRKSKTKIWLRSFSLFCENTQKPRTTAENIAYRTNQLPVGAQVFAATACNPTKTKTLLFRVDFALKRVRDLIRFLSVKLTTGSRILEINVKRRLKC